MIVYFLIASWIIFGVLSIIHESYPDHDYHQLTWGDLIFTIIFLGAIIGPFVGVALIISLIISSSFWHRPVFPKKTEPQLLNEIKGRGTDMEV